MQEVEVQELGVVVQGDQVELEAVEMDKAQVVVLKLPD
jgi:hypothetical protein|tara:strand:+ start:686 stop:799 length:114 start_codon:yes stop_codon:yes gene_type:complete